MHPETMHFARLPIHQAEGQSHYFPVFGNLCGASAAMRS